MPPRLEVLQRVAHEHVQRRVEAQAFLDRRGGRLGVAKKRARIAALRAGSLARALPIACTVASWPALSSRMQVEIKLVLGQLLAVLLGGDQLADQVVARLSAPLGDIGAQEGGEFVRRGDRARPRSRGVRPSWYMPTMRCDQSSRSGARSTGTPSISAMTVIGIGVA